MWTIIQNIVELISPEIRKAIGEFLVVLEEKAKLTPNPMDDVIVFVLKKVMGF